MQYEGYDESEARWMKKLMRDPFQLLLKKVRAGEFITPAFFHKCTIPHSFHVFQRYHFRPDPFAWYMRKHKIPMRAPTATQLHKLTLSALRKCNAGFSSCAASAKKDQPAPGSAGSLSAEAERRRISPAVIRGMGVSPVFQCNAGYQPALTPSRDSVIPGLTRDPDIFTSKPSPSSVSSVVNSPHHSEPAARQPEESKSPSASSFFSLSKNFPRQSAESVVEFKNPNHLHALHALHGNNFYLPSKPSASSVSSVVNFPCSSVQPVLRSVSEEGSVVKFKYPNPLHALHGEISISQASGLKPTASFNSKLFSFNPCKEIARTQYGTASQRFQSAFNLCGKLQGTQGLLIGNGRIRIPHLNFNGNDFDNQHPKPNLGARRAVRPFESSTERKLCNFHLCNPWTNFSVHSCLFVVKPLFSVSSVAKHDFEKSNPKLDIYKTFFSKVPDT